MTDGSVPHPRKCDEERTAATGMRLPTRRTCLRACYPLFLVTLCLPLPTCAPQRATAPPAPTATVSAAPTLAPTPSPLPATIIALPPTPTATPAPVVHPVQSGDTLLGLALRYGVPIAAIQLQNDLGESTVIYAGQTLIIPPPAGWETASPFWAVYVVKEGETLVEIARRFGLEVTAILAANGLSDAGSLQAGQQLVLPLDAPRVASVPTATPLPPPSPMPAPTTEATNAPPSLAAAPPADVTDWPREVVRRINEVRTAHGLPPLAYNETLAQAAQAHADDCSARGWCSHTGSDGADVKTRIRRAGYIPGGWAECWAWTRSPQATVDVWMDEVPPDDPHRRTLLSTWLTEVGVGVAPAGWGYYFIADFGRP